jgi:hypothetical protein
MQNALDEALYESAGRIQFAHDYLRKAVEDRFIIALDLKYKCAFKNLNWFEKIPATQRSIEERLHLTELIYTWKKHESGDSIDSLNHLQKYISTKNLCLLYLKFLRWDSEWISLINELERMKNSVTSTPRWHPLPARFSRAGGPQEDYCEYYQFPCCGELVATSDSSPEQFRNDGCCEYDSNA